MTNDERSPNLEIRNGGTGHVCGPFDIRISVFLRHSTFGFRHCPETARAGSRAMFGASSREYFGDDVAVHVGQTPVRAVVAEGEPLVVDAEQVQDGSVEIVGAG